MRVGLSEEEGRRGKAPPTRVLVIDDDDGVRAAIRRYLVATGHEVQEADGCRTAEEAFTTGSPDVVLLDQQLPDGGGIDLMARLRAMRPDVPVVFLTGHGTIDLAVRAIKAGAEQFLAKPVDLPALRVVIGRLVDDRRSRQREAAGRVGARQPPDPFLGTSALIRRLAEDAQRLAASSHPVLILGETGSGKGVLARWLHDQGPRAQDAFVDLNCAGLSRDLLETELFGHEAGAFTSATHAKTGLMDVADRGTLFLDEIGDMDPAVQPKLLKVVEDQRFRRLGGVRDRHVDVRLIAATHHDLPTLIREGRFREDLYFRVSTLVLTVPPLRERPEDVPLLAADLLARSAFEMRRPHARLAPAALEALQAWPWPGNVRELRNVIERALLVCADDVLGAEALRLGPVPPERSAEPSALATLREVEVAHIRRVLDLEGGHVERSAQRLGVSTSSLYDRLRRYSIR